MAESEFEEYAQRVPRDKLVAHPDSVFRISPTRNWIIDNLPDPDGECLVMLDDDILYLMEMTVLPGYPLEKIISAELVEGVIYNTYRMCLSLQNAYKHRIIFRDTRYSFTYTATFKGGGGASVYRTSIEEREGAQLLKEKWGPCVRIGKKVAWGKKGSPREIAGAVKIHMRLPY